MGGGWGGGGGCMLTGATTTCNSPRMNLSFSRTGYTRQCPAERDGEKEVGGGGGGGEEVFGYPNSRIVHVDD